MLRVDPFAFAAFLGVHVSTVYRWELAKGTLELDTLQRLILEAIDRHRDRRAEIRTAIVDGLIEGGTLVALYRVLTIVAA